MANEKPSVYLASPVFHKIADHEKVSMKFKYALNKSWTNLNTATRVVVSDKRFPDENEIKKAVEDHLIDFIGCHIGHSVTEDVLSVPTVKAVATANVGVNHIAKVPGVLITHAPGAMARTVADYTIALIMANLRDVVGLNDYLWDGKWEAGTRWDLDLHLTKTTENLTLGIVGMGEIGSEVVRRIAAWGMHIAYYDIVRNEALEQAYPNLNYYADLEQLFTISDILSLHVPLNSATRHMVNENLLLKMKPRALLVNTARGALINFDTLMDLLQSKKIALHLAFDVYEEEPLPPEMLNTFRRIAAQRSDLRFIFTPHSASADADTRAFVAHKMLSNLLQLAESTGPEALASLSLIPAQRHLCKQDGVEELKGYRIFQWWQS